MVVGRSSGGRDTFSIALCLWVPFLQVVGPWVHPAPLCILSDLKTLLARLTPSEGALRHSLGCLDALPGCLKAVLEFSWLLLEPSRGRFGSLFGRLGAPSAGPGALLRLSRPSWWLVEPSSPDGKSNMRESRSEIDDLDFLGPLCKASWSPLGLYRWLLEAF
eukprot:7240732-Pyramimonas_sp.AAC.1